jgi:hypothetical protein
MPSYSVSFSAFCFSQLPLEAWGVKSTVIEKKASSVGQTFRQSPIMPFLRSQRTNEGYSMPSQGVSFSVHSFSHLPQSYYFCGFGLYMQKWRIFGLVGESD